MSPGRTLEKLERAKGFEPSTLTLASGQLCRPCNGLSCIAVQADDRQYGRFASIVVRAP